MKISVLRLFLPSAWEKEKGERERQRERKKIHPLLMFRIVHGRFCVISRSVRPDFNNTRSFRVALCSGVELNRGTMLYSLAGLREIGFIARGYRFSLRRYTSDESFFCSCARSPRTNGERYPIEVLVSANRTNVTYDCNVSRLSALPTSQAARGAGWKRQGPAKIEQQGKGKGRVERRGGRRGKLFRNCPFLDWNAGSPSPPSFPPSLQPLALYPSPLFASRWSCAKKKWNILFRAACALRAYAPRTFNLKRCIGRSIRKNRLDCIFFFFFFFSLIVLAFELYDWCKIEHLEHS